MTWITGAQALVEALAREGITTVFGVPGFHNMPIYDALYNHPTVRHILVRHEGSAAFMADGYARAGGGIAAVLTLPGPGATYAYTGIGEAYSDSSPILVLTSQVDTPFIDRDKGLLHELKDQLRAFEPVTTWNERMTKPAAIPDAVRRAVRTMRTGRPRPVQLEIPRDVQIAAAEVEFPQPETFERPAPDADHVRTAARALIEAERPLIYAGGGVVSSEAGPALVHLAEYLGAPVITTGMGMGAFPGDHPLYGGVAWDHAADVTPLIQAADALLAVGTRFTEAFTRRWSLPFPNPTIHIDIDPREIGKNIPVQIEVVGDSRRALQAIAAHLEHMGVAPRTLPHPKLSEAQKGLRQALKARAGSSLPWMHALRDALPRNAVFGADMTMFWADVLACLPVYEPRSVLFPWGYGTLGFGIPAALGARLAQPDRPTVAICGDGGFTYSGMELATAVKYRLNVPIIVFNDNAFGIIKQQQRDSFGGRHIAVDLANPDFVQLAVAFGAQGLRAETPSELGQALLTALSADGPTVIEVPWRGD